MPTDDVSDLRDVVDAINKLCETMKTSYDDYEDCEEIEDDSESVSNNIVTENIKLEPEKCDEVDKIMTETETHVAAETSESVAQLVNKQETTYETDVLDDIHKKQIATESNTKLDMRNLETSSTDIGINSYIVYDVPVTVKEPLIAQGITEKPIMMPKNDDLRHVVTDSECITVASIPENDKSSDKDVSTFTKEFEGDIKNIDLTISDSGAELILCEPTSEMYYTASSEVSLLSDIDLQDKAQSEDYDKEKDDRNSVMAGHVAAMRERFESMTRTNTPCPDFIRSASPSFEVFRNFNTSPDHLE